MSLIFVNERGKAEKFLACTKGSKVMALYVIASSKVSTIHGISIAGRTPKATLYTPAYDIEYLVLGIKGCREIPVTPEGIPTPALITRACLRVSGIPYLVVNAGSYVEPKIPHIVLPSRCVGERIDERSALPYGTSRRLFSEAHSLGSVLSKLARVFVIGESMPGGTTTALAIMTSLGYDAWGRVSSASPYNPHKLKELVVEKALSRLVEKHGEGYDVFTAVDEVGDPLHLSIAGLVLGLTKGGAHVILAGGTQMGAVLAILKDLVRRELTNIAVGTTKWIINDSTSDMKELISEIAPEVPLIAINLDFSNAPYEGLRYYEKGFVKEGVGAGGTAIAAHAIMGISMEKILEEIFKEYAEVIKHVGIS